MSYLGVKALAPMLLYTCVSRRDLLRIAREGLRPSGGEARVCLTDDFEAARRNCSDGALLVIDAFRLNHPLEKTDRQYCLPHVPPEAILNAHPYRRPVLIPAAGGVLVRPGRDEPEVLLIYRRGKWDLPKGKLKPGERPDVAAVREVQEELGITEVRIREPLDITWHAYPLGEELAIKPTYWFLMESAETTFTPRHEEAITDARWFPLSRAIHQLGYPTLRTLLLRHRHRITP